MGTYKEIDLLPDLFDCAAQVEATMYTLVLLKHACQCLGVDMVRFAGEFCGRPTSSHSSDKPASRVSMTLPLFPVCEVFESWL